MWLKENKGEISSVVEEADEIRGMWLRKRTRSVVCD